MNFFLFLLLNAVLYVRPGDWLPVLQTIHLFEIVILSCLFFSLAEVAHQLSARSLAANPITACVIGLFSVAVLTEVARFRPEAAFAAAEDLSKVLTYYLLLVSLVGTTGRIRWLLRALVFSAAVTLGLAVLNYHGVVSVPGMNVTDESFTTAEGDRIEVRRLGTTSILGDPNDCALFIDHCILIGVYLTLNGGGPAPLRALWLLPTGFFAYALTLTQSRGGLVALLAGIAAYLVGRFGRKAAVLGAPLAALVLAVGTGRQGNVSMTGGTGQERVQMWTAYFNFFRDHPLLGLGWNAGPEAASLQAHNSFVQAFGEQGFFGGVLFVGVFYLAVRSFGRVLTARAGPAAAGTEASRLRPCLLAVVVSQMVGMMALTRTFSLPTYTVLGLTAAYARVARVDPPLPTGWRLVRHLLAAGVLFLVYIWVVIRTTVRFS